MKSYQVYINYSLDSDYDTALSIIKELDKREISNYALPCFPSMVGVVDIYKNRLEIIKKAKCYFIISKSQKFSRNFYNALLEQKFPLLQGGIKDEISIALENGLKIRVLYCNTFSDIKEIKEEIDLAFNDKI